MIFLYCQNTLLAHFSLLFFRFFAFQPFLSLSFSALHSLIISISQLFSLDILLSNDYFKLIIAQKKDNKKTKMTKNEKLDNQTLQEIGRLCALGSHLLSTIERNCRKDSLHQSLLAIDPKNASSITSQIPFSSSSSFFFLFPLFFFIFFFPFPPFFYFPFAFKISSISRWNLKKKKTEKNESSS